MTWLKLMDITKEGVRRVNFDQVTDYIPIANGVNTVIWLTTSIEGHDESVARVVYVVESAAEIDAMLEGRPTAVD